MDADEVAARARFSIERFYIKLQEVFPNLVANFDAKWQAWQEGISAESSNPSDWSSLPSFDALLALGPKIIPLVVYKVILKPEDATAIYLYTKLEKDPDCLPPSSLTTPQQQSDSIALTNFHRNRNVRNLITDWTEHCERVSRESNSIAYTECEEYDKLWDLGQGIVPHLMLAYKTSLGNDSAPLFWYDLLHEIIWGHKTGLRVIQFGVQADLWVEWFDGGKGWEQAPKYKKAEEAAYH
ncbi:hypothetical protein B0H63DRAFT_480472 [Podospora didyma]|uniref:Uncharacterized protein n=1 Tax=Podospora didyma TaxID=330526 RepID=A0AAE0KE82_9PEZI|nr:hypothetical protein B0H63DRAFT_480472 [Podospora didyma]